MSKHEILGGKAYLYRRNNSRYWQCAAFLAGYNHRTSTKEEQLADAITFAEIGTSTCAARHRLVRSKRRAEHLQKQLRSS